MSLAVLLLALLFCIYSPTLASSNDTDNDPFHHIARFKQSKPPRDTFCLPSDAPPELLSFEEWKAKQIQSIQPPVVVVVAPDSGTAPETAPLDLENADLNGPATTKLISQPLPSQAPHQRIPVTNRFNYASSDCSARLHSASSASTNPHHILTHKKDKYLLAPCKTNQPKFVIVELCDDIRIDTVQLANYEFFSGVFKSLRVGFAQTLPVGKPESWEGWTEVGVFEAKNARGVQTFHPPDTFRSFYRYIRIDFLSSYGSEYYCPVSLLRVYGLTQMEEWIWEGKEETLKIASVSAVASLAITSAGVADANSQSSQTSQVDPSSSATQTAAPLASETSLPTPENPSSSSDTTSSPQYGSQQSARSVMDMSRSGGAEAGSMSVTAATSSQQAATDNMVLLPTAAVSSDGSPAAATAAMNLLNSSLIISTSGAPASIQTEHSARIIYQESPIVSPTYTPSSATPSAAIATSSLEEQRTKTTPIIVVPAQNPPYVSASQVQPIFTLARTIGTGPSTGESVFRILSNRLTTLEVNTSLYGMFLEEQTRSIRTSLKRMEDHLSVVERDLRKALHEGDGETGLVGRQEWEREREKERLLYEEGMLNCKQKIDQLAAEIRSEKRLGVAQLILLILVLFFSGVNRWGLSMGVDALQASSSFMDHFSDSLSVRERRRVTSLSSIFGRQIGHLPRLSTSNASVGDSDISERSRANSSVSHDEPKDGESAKPKLGHKHSLSLGDFRSSKLRPSPLQINAVGSESDSVSQRGENQNSGARSAEAGLRSYPLSAGLLSSFPMNRSRSNTPNSTLRLSGSRPRMFHRTSSQSAVESLLPSHYAANSSSGGHWGVGSTPRRLAGMSHLHEVKPKNKGKGGNRRAQTQGGGMMEDITNLGEGSSVAGEILENESPGQTVMARPFRRTSTLASSRHRRIRNSRPSTPLSMSRHESASAATTASRMHPSTSMASSLKTTLPQDGDGDESWIDTDTQDTEPEPDNEKGEYYQELEVPRELLDGSTPPWGTDGSSKGRGQTPTATASV